LEDGGFDVDWVALGNSGVSVLASKPKAGSSSNQDAPAEDNEPKATPHRGGAVQTSDDGLLDDGDRVLPGDTCGTGSKQGDCEEAARDVKDGIDDEHCEKGLIECNGVLVRKSWALKEVLSTTFSYQSGNGRLRRVRDIGKLAARRHEALDDDDDRDAGMFFVGDLVACLVHISDSESTSQVALALFRTVSMKAGRVRVTGVKASSLSTRADLVVTG
jgi:hypothetical protein